MLKKGAVLVENEKDILEKLNLPRITQSIKQKTDSKIPGENLILKVLKEKSLHIEKIVEATNLPVQKILSMLATMEIKGQVRNLGGNIFALKR